MRTRSRGFTLIELLVALAILALMALVSWRGLDAMTRAHSHIQERGDALLTLQAGLAQWAADLDAQVPVGQAPALDWDGRTLRITRYSTHKPGEGLLLVAWTLRTINGTSQWLRWQSPPLSTRAALQSARTQATQWAQNPGDAQRQLEVAITAVEQWSVLTYRNGAWSAATTSDGAAGANPSGTSAPTGSAAPSPTSGAPTPAGAASAATAPAPIDAVRLVLTLPPGTAMSGTLTRDWMRGTLGPSR